MPDRGLPRLTVPVTSVPMKLPWMIVGDVESAALPTVIALMSPPAMTLPRMVTVPVSPGEIVMPLLGRSPSGAAPVASVPRRLPSIEPLSTCSNQMCWPVFPAMRFRSAGAGPPTIGPEIPNCPNTPRWLSDAIIPVASVPKKQPRTDTFGPPIEIV